LAQTIQLNSVQMSGFNLAELEAYRKETKAKMKNGNDREFQQKMIPEDGTIELRLLKPRPNQGGAMKFFVEVKTYWFNKKPYMSNCFQGGRDIIGETIADAIALNDKGINALLNDKDKHSVNLNYYIPARIITDTKLSANGKFIEEVVIDPDKDIFVCTIGVFDQINDIVCSKAMNIGRDGGIFDPINGNSISISKTGQKINTKYKAMAGFQFEMPEKYHSENAAADIMAYLRKFSRSDEYLEAAVRNFLYGEDLPKEDIWKKEVEEEDQAPAPVAQPVKAAAPKVTAPPAKTQASAPVAPPKKTTQAPPKKTLVEDLDALADLDDEDEEEEMGEE